VFLLAAAAAARAEVVWDSTFRLTTNSANQITGYSSQHSIAVDDSGNVHVAWLDPRTVPSQIWYRKYDRAGGAWLAETQLSNRSSACQRPAICCDWAGNVHVAWHMENYPCYGIYYKRFDAGAHLWRPDTLLDSGTSTIQRFFPSIARGSGAVHLAYYGTADSGFSYQVFYRRFDPDSGWSAREQITVAACNHDQVSIAADSMDDATAVWCGQDLVPGTWLIYARRRVGGEWQDVELVSDLPNAPSQYGPCAAMNGAGATDVVWYGREQGELYLKVMHRRHDENGWGAISDVSRLHDYQQSDAAVACDADGDCHVLWAGETASPAGYMQLFYAGRDKYGVWSVPTQLTVIDSGDVSYPSVACDRDTGIHVAWYDSHLGNQDVFYRYGHRPGSGVCEGRFPPGIALAGPNPVRTCLQLRGGEWRSGMCIRDVVGRLVPASSYGVTVGPGVVAVDVSRLSSGVYVLRPEAGREPVLRFVVVR
jgi:hypothetical protein